MKFRITALLLFLLAFIATDIYAQKIVVKGTVLDEFNAGLPGASVQVKGTTNGVITDLDGKFTISVPSQKTVLTVSFLGYKPQQVTVGNQNTITIKMESNSQVMNEVVIVGFGTQKKINTTGAVKTIDSKSLESRPISNAVQGLQGVIPGLNITNDLGGGLGQSMNINIRGVGTIGQGSTSSPLVLIDGMEGDLSSINPNDIENISVLKDAAAASIYGSRAPFGVILVTTKSGEKKTQVSYTGNIRISNPISVPDVADSYTHALMTNDAYINSGNSAPYGSTQLKKILAFQRGELKDGIEKAEGQDDWGWGQRSFGNTNWYDVYLKDATTSTEHNLSASGGNDKTTYYASTNYLEQTGLFNFADEKFTRLTVNGKMNIKFNKKVTLNWNSRLVATNNDKPSAISPLFFHNLARRYPLMPVYLPNGEYNQESMIGAVKDGGRNINKNQLIYNQATFTYEPIKNWKIYVDLNSRLESPRSTLQYKKLEYTRPSGATNYYQVMAGELEKTKINDNGTFLRRPAAGTNYYEKANGAVNYFNYNVRTDYNLKKDKHYLKALLGLQSEYYYTETTRVASDDILLDDKPFLPSSSGVNPMMSDKMGEWSSLGIFGRVNYSYADRYMAEINLRYDGASRFPSNQRWAMFPSFSLGWNVAQEKFWAPLADKGFEYLKLRASYGQLGNQNTSNFYPYFQRMSATVGGNVLGGVRATELPVFAPFSTSLTWEKIENAGVGIDAAFFNNRLNATFDWYQRTTKDMVGPAKALPAIYGAASPATNNAELRTRGWELELSWRDRINKDFSYGITATLSDYESIVTKYDSPDGSLNSWYKGKKMGDIWGYQVVGIAKSDKEMNDYLAKHSQTSIGQKWGGGDVMYRDLDNSGSVNTGSNSIADHGDLSVIGNATPRYAFGLTLDVKYKFIDFRAFFQGVGKQNAFIGNSTFFGFFGEWNRTLLKDHLDYFRYAGSELGANMNDPYYGRLRTDRNNTQVCDRYMQDASYVRLKNIQIGFSLPSNTKLSKVIKKGRFYVSGENLFTLTNLRILDPETVGDNGVYAGSNYPMYRVWSAGLEITF